MRSIGLAGMLADSLARFPPIHKRPFLFDGLTARTPDQTNNAGLEWSYLFDGAPDDDVESEILERTEHDHD